MDGQHRRLCFHELRMNDRATMSCVCIVNVYSGEKTAKMETRLPRSSTLRQVVAKPMLDMSAPLE
jgi:hypothetical protein